MRRLVGFMVEPGHVTTIGDYCFETGGRCVGNRPRTHANRHERYPKADLQPWWRAPPDWSTLGDKAGPISPTNSVYRVGAPCRDGSTIRSGWSCGQVWAGEHHHAQLIVGDESRLPRWRGRQVVGVVENRCNHIVIRKDDKVRIEAVDRTGVVEIATSARTRSDTPDKPLLEVHLAGCAACFI